MPFPRQWPKGRKSENRLGILQRSLHKQQRLNLFLIIKLFKKQLSVTGTGYETINAQNI